MNKQPEITVYYMFFCVCNPGFPGVFFVQYMWEIHGIYCDNIHMSRLLKITKHYICFRSEI